MTDRQKARKTEHWFLVTFSSPKKRVFFIHWQTKWNEGTQRYLPGLLVPQGKAASFAPSSMWARGKTSSMVRNLMTEFKNVHWYEWINTVNISGKIVHFFSARGIASHCSSIKGTPCRQALIPIELVWVKLFIWLRLCYFNTLKEFPLGGKCYFATSSVQRFVGEVF